MATGAGDPAGEGAGAGSLVRVNDDSAVAALCPAARPAARARHQAPAARLDRAGEERLASGEALAGGVHRPGAPESSSWLVSVSHPVGAGMSALSDPIAGNGTRGFASLSRPGGGWSPRCGEVSTLTQLPLVTCLRCADFGIRPGASRSAGWRVVTLADGGELFRYRSWRGCTFTGCLWGGRGGRGCWPGRGWRCRACGRC
jgi:hypothetical protein